MTDVECRDAASGAVVTTLQGAGLAAGARAMPRLLRGCGVALLVSSAVAGCSPLGEARRSPDGDARWVLVSNIRYRAEGSEPEYVWVRENEIPSTLTTVLFGKNAIIAPPQVVPRYAPPPGSGVISPLQGGPYAASQPETLVGASAPARRSAAPPATAPPAPVAPGPIAAVPPGATPGVTARGYVVYVDANQVVIDLSAQQGLKLGDVVRVTRGKLSIVHPVTGAYLGELDEDVGTAQVVELREKFAIAEIRDVKAGAEIRVKDRVVPRQ